MHIVQSVKANRIQLTTDEISLIDRLLTSQSTTRIGLSDELGVSPAWITKTIKPLMSRNLVTEFGEAKKSGGCRAKILGINPEVEYILGLDLGGDLIKVGFSDLNVREFSFKNISMEDLKTSKNRDRSFMEKTHSLLQDHGLTQGKLRAIGLCLTGPVSHSEGVGDVKPPQFSPSDSAIIHSFIEQFPETLILADRDARMMALGEQAFGKGQDVDNFVFLTIGNKISAGLVFDGRLYQGASGCAGDIGHIIVEKDGLECYYGKRGCLVTVVGERAITSLMKELALSGQSPLLFAKLDQVGNPLSTLDLVETASQGEIGALKLINRCGEYIAKVLTDMVQLFNPDSVIVGGGITKMGHRFLNSMRQVVLSQANPMATRDLRIESSQLGERAGVLGAIKMAQHELFVETVA